MRRAHILAPAAALLLCACGGAPSQPDKPPAPTVDAVRVEPGTVDVFIGATQQLTATPVDGSGNAVTGQTIVWSSDATGIATVSETGLVTAVGAGVAHISATAAGKVGTSSVTAKLVPVASVDVTPRDTELIAGRTLHAQLAARDSAGHLLTGRAAVWVSSNPQVATVSDSGLVAAVAPGNATITGTVENHSDSAVVTVTAATSSAGWSVSAEEIGTYVGTPGSAYEMFWATGDFNGDGLQDAVVTSWSGHASGPAELTPVQLYLRQSDGAMKEASAAAFGGAVTAHAQQPKIGDLNHDGIDDIVLPPFIDIPPDSTTGLVLVSGGGTFSRRELLPKAWVHGSALADVTGDGCLDLITPDQRMGLMRGDCTGNFTANPWPQSGANAGFLGGMSTCVADFDGDGKPEVVLTDGWADPKPLADNFVYEMDWTHSPPLTTVRHVLPLPVWDRDNTSGTMQSHDQRCVVADLDGDGRQDIVVSSTYWPPDGVSWQDWSHIQVYMNRGNFNFEDITDRAFPGRSYQTGSSFMVFVRDMNGDGIPDLYYPAASWDGIQPNQMWLGNGDGTFRPAGVQWDAMFQSAVAEVKAHMQASSDLNLNRFMPVIPMERRDGRYDFIVMVLENVNDAGVWHEVIHVELLRTGTVF